MAYLVWLLLFWEAGVTVGDGTDALNASLSADIVSSTPFLLELSTMEISVAKNEVMTLNTYLDEESSPCWSYVIGFPGMVIGGGKAFVCRRRMSPYLLVKQIRAQLNFQRRNRRK